MESKKVNKEINNVKDDNLKALAQLFPSVIKDGKLDVEALKEELGEYEEVNKKEKYELTWTGKQRAKQNYQEDVYNKTLKYFEKEGKNTDTTENIYIEGDNLEVLKLLRSNYYNSIKMIYIDPPYNTGNDFVYNDNFSMSKEQSDLAEGLVNEAGERLEKNQKTSNKYHANWLNMMYPRLKLARDLLTDDGVIFISIDDNEQANLKKICDEIFGEENFVGIFIINTTPNARDYGHIGKQHEYTLFYSKNKNLINTNLLPEIDKKFSYTDEYGGYNIHPLYNSNEAFNSNNRPNLYYPFYLYVDKQIGENFFKIGLEKKENSIEIYPPLSSKNKIQFVWRWGKEKSSKGLNDEIIGYKNKNGEYKIVQKMRHSEKLIRSIITGNEYTSRRGTFEVEEIFNNKIFSFPKTVKLIKDYLIVSCEKNDIVLDFFSGSATTAHAVMQLNLEDNGNRKYIMVQLPELTYTSKKQKYKDENGIEKEKDIIDKETNYPVVDKDSEARKAGYYTIAEIGKERIRRAGEKIKQEIEEYNNNLKLGEEPKKIPDIGFKVFKVDKTNIKWNNIENIDIDNIQLSSPDIIDFELGTNDIDVVYELMLRQRDVKLSETIEVLNNIGNRTYLYASSYLVCLETTITVEIIEKLAELDPLPTKFIFRDSAFKDDIALKDETFRRLEMLVKRNHEKNSIYGVEFI